MNRRTFLRASAGVSAAPFLASSVRSVESTPLRIAAANSVYYKLSHAYHILGRMIDGYTINGKLHKPSVQIQRIYNQQYHADGRMKDLARPLSKRTGIPLVNSVAEAVGNADLDGVLLIAEHGDYPQNTRGQILYPRADFFEQIVSAFRTAKRTTPVFIDKHLSFDHVHARKMFDTAKALGFPLMAGSSLPVTWRSPEWEPEFGANFEEVVVCYHGAHLETWAFHALETAQCLLERRKGGEVGVKSVQAISGQAVWTAWDRGAWSKELAEAALRRSGSRDFGAPRDHVEDPTAITVEYADGPRATLLHLPGYIADVTVAVKLKGDRTAHATQFVLPLPPGARFFNPLTWYIEQFLKAKKPSYPVERTLLTSTVLDFAMRSRADGGKPISHEAMKIAYTVPNESWFFRGKYTDE